MRQITSQLCRAFQYGRKLSIGNTKTDGRSLFLHGNEIARRTDFGLYITNAGWASNTTKERLNGLDGVSIYQKNFDWYLNGKKWDGKWINVSTGVAGYPADDGEPASPEAKAGGMLKSVAMVAMMGDILCKDQKAKNDWKTRMLKAGLDGRGLIMPEDWESLSEAEKERRLDGSIKILATN